MIGIKILVTIFLYMPFCAIAGMSLIATIPGVQQESKGITPLHLIRYATILIWLAATGLFVWFLTIEI
jgi:hypothetical protein